MPSLYRFRLALKIKLKGVVDLITMKGFGLE